MILLIKLLCIKNLISFQAVEAFTVAELMKTHLVNETTSLHLTSPLSWEKGKQQQTINLDFPILFTSLKQLKPKQQSSFNMAPMLLCSLEEQGLTPYS